MSSKVVELIQDEDGSLILPLDEETLQQAGWNTGDTIEFKDNGDGSWTMSKKEETEIILVETVQTFHHTYAVRVPKGKAEWALDTVASEEAEEVSQEHLGEQIVTHRVVTEEEYLRVFDKQNDYLKSWTTEQKMEYVKDVSK